MKRVNVGAFCASDRTRLRFGACVRACVFPDSQTMLTSMHAHRTSHVSRSRILPAVAWLLDQLRVSSAGTRGAGGTRGSLVACESLSRSSFCNDAIFRSTIPHRYNSTNACYALYPFSPPFFPSFSAFYYVSFPLALLRSNQSFLDIISWRKRKIMLRKKNEIK